MERKLGFAPVFNTDSRILILGSFPSVKSREIDFYYGNKQNRFWKMLCGYFGEEIPETIIGKKEFLFRRGIALWDMAISCKIEGSADANIKDVELADLNEVLSHAHIEQILLNGTLAYDLFMREYSNIQIPYSKMPSTSPANPRYQKEIWYKTLNDTFGKEQKNNME